MDPEKYSDTHTLYVKCETATEAQIRQCFYEALSSYQQKTGRNLDTRFKVNLVTDKDGKCFGLAFVYLIESAFYHMLLGKNSDGSDRIEYIDDPSHNLPSDGKLENESGWSSLKQLESMSWADICDLDDEFEEIPKTKIVTRLDPLIVLPPYTLTESQIQSKKQKIIMSNIHNPDFDETKITIPSISHLQIEKAIVSPVESKFMHNILKSRLIPDWITKEDLKIKFSPYATDNTTLYERTLKGVTFNETYPFVNINHDRVCFIIFDPSTHDAQFALLMNKKTLFRKQGKQGAQLSACLHFSHSFCTDRDMMTTFTNKPKVVPRNNKHGQKKYHPEPKSQHNSFKTKNCFSALICE